MWTVWLHPAAWAVVVAGLIGFWLLRELVRGPVARPPVVLAYAAGLRHAAEPAAAAFERQTRQPVALMPGGTGTLYSRVKLGGVDVFLAADAWHVELGVAEQVLVEPAAVAWQTPVAIVAEGNPRRVATVDDLLRDDVRMALADPEQAAIGRATRAALGERWSAVRAAAKVVKPTVGDVALDVQLGAADVAIVWDHMATRWPGVERVDLPDFAPPPERVTLAIVADSERPAAARLLAKFLTDGGRPHFAAAGLAVDGGGE